LKNGIVAGSCCGRDALTIRVDTTVVESNIHCPTNSGLLDDRDAGADADDEKDRGQGGRTERESARHSLRKAGKPSEFGKLVRVQEAENQMVTHYEVFEEWPSDRHLLQATVEAQRRKLGRVPQLVAAGAGFYCQVQE
jgi:hypothetical protein